MKTITKPTFQELLDKTGRKQYTDKTIVDAIAPSDPQEIIFFKPGKYVSNEQLAEEYASRGLEPAHPYAFILYSMEYESEMDEKEWVATCWKQGDHFEYAAANRWHGKRGLGVDRSRGGWYGRWSFVGVPRKSSALGSSALPSDTLTLCPHCSHELKITLA